MLIRTDQHDWDKTSLKIQGYADCRPQILDFFAKASLLDRTFEAIFMRVEFLRYSKEKKGYKTIATSKDLVASSGMPLCFKYSEQEGKKQFLASMAKEINTKMQVAFFNADVEIGVARFLFTDFSIDPPLILRTEINVKEKVL